MQGFLSRNKELFTGQAVFKAHEMEEKKTKLAVQALRGEEPLEK